MMLCNMAILRAAGYARPIYIHGAMEKITDYYIKAGVELGEIKRLLAIAPCLVRIRVHLDQHAIGAGGNCNTRQCRHQFAMPGCVAWIGNDGKVRNLLEQRNGGRIESVPRGGFKSADAALAKDHVGVAVIEDALCRA